MPAEIKLGPLAGLLGAAVFTGGWILAGLAQNHTYRWSAQEISDLGAMTARHAWLWNVSDSLSGGLIALFAISLGSAVGTSQTGRIGALLIGVVGIGGVLDGLFREDCPLSTSARCQRLRQHPGLSWHHQAHDVESVLVAVAALLAPFIMARTFSQLPSSRAVRDCSIAAGLALLVLGGVYASLYGRTGGGIAQRLLVSVFMAWIVMLAAWARKKLNAADRAGLNVAA